MKKSLLILTILFVAKINASEQLSKKQRKQIKEVIFARFNCLSDRDILKPYKKIVTMAAQNNSAIASKCQTIQDLQENISQERKKLERILSQSPSAQTQREQFIQNTLIRALEIELTAQNDTLIELLKNAQVEH